MNNIQQHKPIINKKRQCGANDPTRLEATTCHTSAITSANRANMSPVTFAVYDDSTVRSG